MAAWAGAGGQAACLQQPAGERSRGDGVIGVLLHSGPAARLGRARRSRAAAWVALGGRRQPAGAAAALGAKQQKGRKRAFLRMAIRVQSKTENKPPQTAKLPPRRGASNRIACAAAAFGIEPPGGVARSRRLGGRPGGPGTAGVPRSPPGGGRAGPSESCTSPCRSSRPRRPQRPCRRPPRCRPGCGAGTAPACEGPQIWRAPSAAARTEARRVAHPCSTLPLMLTALSGPCCEAQVRPAKKNKDAVCE